MRNVDIKSHKLAAKFILNQIEDIQSIKLFENDFVNSLYYDLLKETKKSYNLIKQNSSIDNIANSLDKKRLLAKRFESFSNIKWKL